MWHSVLSLFIIYLRCMGGLLINIQHFFRRHISLSRKGASTYSISQKYSSNTIYFSTCCRLPATLHRPTLFNHSIFCRVALALFSRVRPTALPYLPYPTLGHWPCLTVYKSNHHIAHFAPFFFMQLFEIRVSQNPLGLSNALRNDTVQSLEKNYQKLIKMQALCWEQLLRIMLQLRRDYDAQTIQGFSGQDDYCFVCYNVSLLSWIFWGQGLEVMWDIYIRNV